MAGDKVRDHFQRNVLELVGPRIEDAAPDGLFVRHGVLIVVIVLAAVELCVGSEHALELLNGHADHRTVVPRRGAKRVAAEALQAAVKPVQHGEIGLADPAVTPNALEEGDGVFALENVGDHLAVVVEPNVVEVVEGVLHAAPLAVLIEAGLVEHDVAEAAFTVRLAVPEIFQGFLHFGLIHSSRPPSPGSS